MAVASSRARRRDAPPALLAWLVLAAGAAMAPVAPARADLLGAEAAIASTTTMEVFVEPSRVRVELATGVPDLIRFEAALPDDFRVRMGFDPDPSDERVERFFAEELVIRADDGPPLPGRRLSFETGRRWPLDELTGAPERRPSDPGVPMAAVVLAYDLGVRPEALRLEPSMVGRGRRPATVDLVVFHLGVPLGSVRRLTSAVVVDLDWQDPWRSEIREPEARRPFQGPLQVFLTVAAGRATAEVVARPVDLQRWTDVGIGGLAQYPVGSQEAMGRRIAELVADHLELTVDGVPTGLTLERIDLVAPRFGTAAVPMPPRELAAEAVFLRAVFVRPVAATVADVELAWTFFPEGVAAVAGAIIEGGESAPVPLTRDANVLRWSRLGEPAGPAEVEGPPSPLLRPLLWLLRVGLVVVGLLLIRSLARAAGGGESWTVAVAVASLTAAIAIGSWTAARAAKVGDARAGRIVAGLLRNVYRSFGAPDAEAVAAALQHGVDAASLDRVAAASRRCLELAGGDGRLAGFRDLKLVDVVARRDRSGFVASCSWEVVATTSHWGHVHRGTRRCRAELAVAPVGRVWKIVGWEPPAKAGR